MPATALLDPHARRPQRRGGSRRASGDGALPLTRHALVADFLALCQLDPAIDDVKAPAPPAEFVLDDATVEHVADFEVTREGTACLIDIAAESDLAAHRFRACAIESIQALDGRTFRIETAASIRAEPRFTTVRLILACKRTPVTAGDRVRILHQLDECGTMRLVDCAGAAQNTTDGVAAVLALACEGLIAVDTARPILPETHVRRRKVPYPDPFGF